LEARGSREQGRHGAGRAGRGARRARWSLLLIGAVACVTTLSSSDLQPFHRSAAVEGASEKVGADECETCHEDVHGRAPAPSYHADCEACHGPGDLHTDSEEVADIRFPSNADCEACHDTGHRTLLEWTMSEHNRSGVFCTDCHAAHEREPWQLRQPGALAQAVAPHAGDVTLMCSS